MYDELIERLRETPSIPVDAKLHNEAADAIEELQGELQALKDDTDMAIVEDGKTTRLCFVKKWIPVTERLPKAERKSYWVCTDTGYQCTCRWTNNLFGMGESDEWGWSIFDIPQYQKVVAWMPLPDPYEPPKDGET